MRARELLAASVWERGDVLWTWQHCLLVDKEEFLRFQFESRNYFLFRSHALLLQKQLKRQPKRRHESNTKAAEVKNLPARCCLLKAKRGFASSPVKWNWFRSFLCFCIGRQKPLQPPPSLSIRNFSARSVDGSKKKAEKSFTNASTGEEGNWDACERKIIALEGKVSLCHFRRQLFRSHARCHKTLREQKGNKLNQLLSRVFPEEAEAEADIFQKTSRNFGCVHVKILFIIMTRRQLLSRQQNVDDG